MDLQSSESIGPIPSISSRLASNPARRHSFPAQSCTLAIYAASKASFFLHALSPPRGASVGPKDLARDAGHVAWPSVTFIA